MDDLMVWLRERIAARRALAEGAAEEAGGMVWEQRSTTIVLTDDRDREVLNGDAYPEILWHVVANDPQAMLDLCDAHTALLDTYEQVQAKAEEYSQQFVANLRVGKHVYTEEYQEERRQGQEHAGRMWGMRVAVLTVSAAYRRDPGYREEWARWSGVPAVADHEADSDD